MIVRCSRSPLRAAPTAPATTSAIHSSGSAGPGTCSTRRADDSRRADRSDATVRRSRLFCACCLASSTRRSTPAPSNSNKSAARHLALLLVGRSPGGHARTATTYIAARDGTTAMIFRRLAGDSLCQRSLGSAAGRRLATACRTPASASPWTTIVDSTYVLGSGSDSSPYACQLIGRPGILGRGGGRAGRRRAPAARHSSHPHEHPRPRERLRMVICRADRPPQASRRRGRPLDIVRRAGGDPSTGRRLNSVRPQRSTARGGRKA
jgi:hypothetical protein